MVHHVSFGGWDILLSWLGGMFGGYQSWDEHQHEDRAAYDRAHPAPGVATTPIRDPSTSLRANLHAYAFTINSRYGVSAVQGVNVNSASYPEDAPTAQVIVNPNVPHRQLSIGVIAITPMTRRCAIRGVRRTGRPTS
jgi:hypothetical protein